MQTRRRYRHRSQGRSRHLNTPDAIRHRRALADAKREELAATLPPAPTGPEPLTLWQRIVVEVYVPTSGRCDQHATVIDGERVGLLSASRIGVKVREAIRKRPSVDYLAEARQQGWCIGACKRGAAAFHVELTPEVALHSRLRSRKAAIRRAHNPEMPGATPGAATTRET